MILVEVQRPFNVRFRGGRTLSLHPGQRVQVPEGKVGELVKRGLARIVSGPDERSSCDGSIVTDRNGNFSETFPTCDGVLDPVQLIKEALDEIESSWTRGAWSWCKRHDPDTYRKIIAMERQIDRFSRERRIQELEIALRRWKEAILALVEKCLKNSRGPDQGKLFS